MYNNNIEKPVREFLCNYVTKNMNQDPKSVEGFILALERDWYYLIDPSLLLITDDKWKEYGIPDRLVQAMKAVSYSYSYTLSYYYLRYYLATCTNDFRYIIQFNNQEY